MRRTLAISNLSGPHFEPYNVKATNDRWKHMVLVFKNSGAKDVAFGQPFTLDAAPTTIKARIHWTSTVTTNNVRLGFAYRAVAAAESLDQSGQAEDVAANDAPPAATDQLQTLELALTAGNFALGDLVEWEVYRDSSDAGDTHTGDITVHAVEIETT
jgi:hypothetical protein